MPERRMEPVARAGRTKIDVSRYAKVRVEGTDGDEMTVAVHAPELEPERIRRLLHSVEVTRRDDGAQVRVNASGPPVEQKSRLFGLLKSRKRPYAELRLTLPRGQAVELSLGGGTGAEVVGVDGGVRGSSSGGSMTFFDVAGGVHARVRGGHLQVGGVLGAVDLKISGGSIHVWDAEGPVHARVSGGFIVLKGIRGDLEARTSGGVVDVCDAGGSVDATARGGFVAVRQSAPPGGDHRLEASGGDVVLQLPAGSGGDLSADAGRGRVTVHLDGTTVRGDGDLAQRIGDGGPRFDLRARGGDVRVLHGASRRHS